MVQKLVEFHQKGLLSFKHVVTFNMDEYVKLPKEHPESYHSFMWKNLFQVPRTPHPSAP
jgi:glucosamine-6-phosphate deaminase